MVIIVSSRDRLNDVPVKFLLDFGERIVGIGLCLFKQLAIPLAPFLLHHLLPSIILRFLLLFLLLSSLLILLFLDVLLLSSMAIAITVFITIMILFFIKQLHLMNEGI